MANATVSRLGQVDLANDAKALFLKVYAGEIITSFETKVVLKALTRQRTITSGKSASFPTVYKAGGGYHTPGNEIVGTAISHNEVVVSIDDLLLSDAFIANIDEAMNHFDVRSTYSVEQGRYLATEYDKNVARNIIRAARASALHSGDTGGQSVTDADGDDTLANLKSALWSAKQKLEEADVPVEDLPVNAALKPAQWYLLAQDTTAILNRDVDGDGSYSKGQFSMVGGIQVYKSNALPWAVDDSSNTDIPSDYRINMTNTFGAVFTEAAAATVQLLGLAMESEYDIRRQGTLMVAKYAVGHGPLVPKCAVELKLA